MTRVIKITMADGRSFLDLVSMDTRIEAVVASGRTRNFRMLRGVSAACNDKIPREYPEMGQRMYAANSQITWREQEMKGQELWLNHENRVKKKFLISNLGTLCDGWGGYVDQHDTIVSHVPENEWGLKHDIMLFRPDEGELDRVGYVRPKRPVQGTGLTLLTRLPFFTDRLFGV